MIQGCLPISGIMDLHDPQPAPQSLEERVYTTVLRGLDPLQDAVHSPLYWTAGNQVPFDLSVGEKDSARVLRSNRRMLPLLLAQQATATLHGAPGLDHFQTHLQLRDPACPWSALLAGRVHTILPEIQNGSVKLLVALEQPSHPLLRNKLRVDVNIIIEQKANVLVADSGPAFNGKGRQPVFVLRGGMARKTMLDIGAGDGKAVEIAGGAQAGERVIISDTSRYQEHDSI
eukprot:gene565-654_t